MSSTGNPELPPPREDALDLLLAPAPTDRAAYIEKEIKAHQILGGTLSHDEAHIKERAGKFFDRGLRPAGAARQIAAIFASGSRVAALKSVSLPILVIHGDADPLVPVEGGIDTANTIPGAELLVIEGMGHSWPQVVWPQLVAAIAGHAKST
jgi:pimeloyl-ACP methyl ester carboxylesterase